jgi:Mrp family chromosome partitioning ATPase
MVQTPINEFHLLLKALGYLRTHWWLFVLEILAIYSLSLHKFYRTPPVYDSEAVILIDTSRRQLYQSVLLPSMSGGQARKQNIVHVLTGQEVIERFRSQLTDFYNSEGRPNHLRHLFPNGTAYTGEILKTMVGIGWDKGSDIYNLRCKSINPEAAHDLCAIYLNTIQAYYPEIGQRETMMKRDFLSRQIATFINQIKEREQMISDFQKKNTEFLNFVTFNQEEKGMQKLRAERNAIRTRMISNRALFRLFLNVPRAKQGEHTARSTAIAQLTQKVNNIQYQIELTETSSLPDREQSLITLKENLLQTTTQLQKLNEEEVRIFMATPLPNNEVRKRVSELKFEYEIDQIKLAETEKQLEALTIRERSYNTLRLEYERLFMELNHKKRLLANLYQKEQETEIELSAGNAEIFRLQEATRNGHRTAPILSKHLYGSFSIALFFLLVTVVTLMAFFPRLDSEAEVYRLNLPVLGKVPLLKRHRDRPDEIPHYGLEYLKIMNYRIIRETKDLRCPIVVISSPHAREGKSTMANLLCLANQNPARKSLLIDGDLLTVHPNKFFGITEDHTPGLRSLFDGTHNGPISDLVVKTNFDGISFLPRGGRYDPSMNPNFQKTVEALLVYIRKEYDVIYIDTPPLFASNLAHQWAGLADLIVLVARIYSTRPKDISEAIQTCKVFSKAPVGIALNCVRLSSANRRASNYYFSKKKPNPARLAA